MVISWILNFVSQEIADSLMYMATARHIWTDLCDRFQQSNAPRVFQIKKLLSVLQQGSMDIFAYYTKLRTLWDELMDFLPVSACSCGAMKEWTCYYNQECVMQFLMGLNESYSQVRAQVLIIDLLEVISKVFSLVMQEERQRSIHQSASKDFLDRHSGFTPQVAAVGVRRYQNNRGPKEGRAELLCSPCGFTNHSVDKCFKLHDYPPGHPKYDQKQPQSHGRMQVNQVSATDLKPQSVSNMSITDLTPFQCQLLITFLNSKLQVVADPPPSSQQQEPTVSCFNGIHSLSNFFHKFSPPIGSWTRELLITFVVLWLFFIHINLCLLQLPYLITFLFQLLIHIRLSHGLILDDVLFVPYLHFNLTSISSLTKQHRCVVSFFTNSCHIQDFNRTKVIGKGK